MKACAANSTLLAQAGCSATTHTPPAQQHTPLDRLHLFRATRIHSRKVSRELKALQFLLDAEVVPHADVFFFLFFIIICVDQG